MNSLANNILTIEQLKKYFITHLGTVRAVDGVSFSVEEGTTFGLVGESGSGKSTVAHTVVGIYRPTEGRITYRGLDISKESKKRSKTVRKEVQLLFQDPGTSLNPRKNIKQILELPLEVCGVGNSKNRTERIEELLRMMELPLSYMYKYPQSIGGGEKQMVALARALAADPAFIVLDEPTSALDVSVQAKIINLLIRLQEQVGLSYLFITHDLSLMRNMASRVAIMYLGRICEMAPASEFFEAPVHPYTQMLLSSIPVISEEEEALKPKKITSTGEIPSPVNIPPGCSFHPRCRYAQDICKTEVPVYRDLGDEHFVTCHFADSLNLQPVWHPT